MTNAAKLPLLAPGFPRGNRLAGPCGALLRRHGLKGTLAADLAADLSAFGTLLAEVFQHFRRKLLPGHTSILNRVIDKSGKWEEEESEELDSVNGQQWRTWDKPFAIPRQLGRIQDQKTPCIRWTCYIPQLSQSPPEWGGAVGGNHVFLAGCVSHSAGSC